MTRDAFYSQLDKILLAGLIGGGIYVGTGGVKDELVKIRETLAAAVTRLEGHEQRLSNLETLFLRPNTPSR